MQKFSKALLQRSAVAASLERKGTCSQRVTYKMSLPLVLFLSGLFFLLSFLSSHGNDLRDELEVEHGDSNRYDTQITSIKSSVDHIETNLGEEFKEALQFTPQESTHLLEGKSLNIEELVNNAYMSSSNTVDENHEIKEPTDTRKNLEKEASLKNGRLSHAVPSLDEFKIRATGVKEKKLSSQTDIVIHRLEPGGKEYNYASAKKGAKVLNSNKEAKGASNILDKDGDKYLRNPCSAEEKFVTIELSEETLVDTIVIGNFEHYSSNFKDFELYSSLSYPMDSWVKLGNFTAQNVKHKHKFYLSEPKWARYLKLNLLSHYGSEFYCTLSVVEVFGVDAVERMLEDLMSAESKNSKLVPHHEERIFERVTQVEASNEDHHRQQEFVEKATEDFSHECPKPSVSNVVSDSRPMQIGRMPGDAILKILLQKVQFLDLSFSVLEKYLEELNGRYTRIFKEIDGDMSDKVVMLEKMESELKILHSSKDTCAKENEELQSWKSLVSAQLDQLSQDNINLRSEFKKARDDQADMENRSLAVIYISSMFGALAAAKMCSGMFLNVFGTQKSAWFFLLLSSCLVTFILLI